MILKKKGVLIMLLSALFALFGLTGCVDISLPGTRPESGGVTDKTDPKAPTEIESDEITEFYADLTLYGEWSPGRDTVKYTFEIKKNDEGVLTVYEDTAAVSAPADDAVLTGLQELIEKFGLAKKNGYYRVTAGLPPEFQETGFKVLYASGETIRFTENNEPESEWRQALYLLFAGWFADQGDDSLLPEEYAGQAERIDLTIVEDGIMTSYNGIYVKEKDAIDGEQYLFMKDVYDNNEEKTVSYEYTLFPEDYFDKVSGMFAKYDLRPFYYWSALYGYGRPNYRDEPEPYTADIRIYVEFEDGNRLNIETNDPGDKELLRPLLDDLVTYFDSLFEQ